jgi:hypothetical protein
MCRTTITLLLALGMLASSGQAQRLAPSLLTSPDSPLATPRNARVAELQSRSGRSPVLLTLGGVLAGTAGAFAGAAIGNEITKNTCEDCFLEGVIYGGMAGGSALLPLGVHLANGRRGNYGASLLASLGIGAAGLAIAVAANEGGVLLPVPVLQLVSSILIERKTAR